jgi:hypothetical protein
MMGNGFHEEDNRHRRQGYSRRPRRLHFPVSVNLAGFTSNIPVIVLRADRAGAVSTSKVYSPFTMEITSRRPIARFVSPMADRDDAHGVRVRGQVSRLFPKRSYRLQIQNEQGASAAKPLLGMPADNDWVLQGPWLDKSLIRNAFSYDLARAMGTAGMRTRACEVFLSTSGKPVRDADYVGVYQLTEDIERGDERVKLARLGPDDNTEPAITGGYLLAWDVGDGTYLPRWNSIQVKYPKAPSKAQIAWIDRAITQFDQALKGANSRDPATGYAAYIEVDDWVNYILFEELAFNLDAYVRSFYLQKDRGRKIRPGPVWDHDLGLGHQFPPSTPFNQWWFIARQAPHGWVPRLMDDPAFVKKDGCTLEHVAKRCLARRTDRGADRCLRRAPAFRSRRPQLSALEDPQRQKSVYGPAVHHHRYGHVSRANRRAEKVSPGTCSVDGRAPAQ